MRRSVRRRREGTGSLLPKTLKARAQVIFKHPYIELLWHQHGHPPLISGALCIYAEARQRESLVLVEKSVRQALRDLDALLEPGRGRSWHSWKDETNAACRLQY